jgi:polysaccharide export outer membrane protein
VVEITQRQKVQLAGRASFSRYIVPGATLVLLTLLTAVNGQSEDAPRPAASDLTVTSATDTQNRSHYLIGPGDVLDIRVFGRPQLTRDAVRVDMRGMIRMPLIEEEVQVSCRSEASLAQYISAQYLKYVRRPQVDVFIREYNSQPVAVVGAVNRPGRFQLQRQVRLLELLTFSGGPTERAGRTIQVAHAENSQHCENSSGSADGDDTGLNAYGLSDVLAGRDEANPFVRPGDVVSVLEADQVFVVGNVMRPSSIPLKEPLTISRAIAMSGGVLPYSKTNRIRIIRKPPDSAPQQEIVIDLKAIEKKHAEDIVLQANDIVDVPVSGGKRLLGNLVGSIGPAVTQMPVRIIP